MNISKGTRHSSGPEIPSESLGRKLFRLFVQFCVCLLLIPAVLAGLGALVGLFTGSVVNTMIVGLIAGIVLGGLGFNVIANYASSNSLPPGGHGGFGGGDMGGGGDGGGSG